MQTQMGMFDGELADRKREIAEYDAAVLRARTARFEERKAVMMADTKSWKGGVFTERVETLLQVLKDAGEEAKGMHDAILIGINSAANMGRLTEAHVAFVEEKARIEVARLGVVQPAAWDELTIADIGKDDFGSGQLPVAIQQAAVNKLNVLGPQLSALGFKSDYEVNASAPTETQSLKSAMSEVRQSLMILAPARYRHAKGHKLASEDKLNQAETYASKVLGIDTREHQGIDVSVAITSGGIRQKPLRSGGAAKDQAGSSRTLVCEGLHIGRVEQIEAGMVAQKTGRSATVLTWHSRPNLVGASMAVGDVVEIQYRDGVGHVAGKNQARELFGQAR